MGAAFSRAGILKGFLLVVCSIVSLSLAGLMYFVRTERRQAACEGRSQTNPDNTRRAAPAKFDWRQVESADYRTYIANLRSIGCPEETIRDIILADVSKYYVAQIAALATSSGEVKFWQTVKPVSPRTALEQQQQIAAIQRARRKTIQELLGIDVDAEMRKYGLPQNDWTGDLVRVDESTAERAVNLEFLMPEKREALAQVDERFRLAQQSVYAQAQLESTSPDWGELRRLKQQKGAELSRILTATEIEEVELRTHPIADSMRHTLAGFEPTEDEFRTLFRILKAQDDAFAFIPPDSETAQQERLAAQRQISEQIKTALGEQRYGEYQRTMNGGFHELYLLASQFDLPTEAAAKVYDANKALQLEWEKTQADSNLSDEQKTSVLQSLQVRTEANIREALGNSLYDVYQRRDINRMMQN